MESNKDLEFTGEDGKPTWLSFKDWKAMMEFMEENKRIGKYVNDSIDESINNIATKYCDENIGNGLTDQIDKDE